MTPAATPFTPFDPRGIVATTRRHLPHWHQPGATYFITFRLADSLPADVSARLAELRAERLHRAALSVAPAVATVVATGVPPVEDRIVATGVSPVEVESQTAGRRDAHRCYVSTRVRPVSPSAPKHRSNADDFAWVDHYLDAGSGSCRLARPVNAHLVEAALRHADGSRYLLGAYCVMPNHVHAVFLPIAPHTLASLCQALKSYTAHAMNRLAGQRGGVWQEESFDRLVRDDNELRAFEHYVLQNPIVAKLPEGTFRVGRGTAQWT